MIVTLELTPEEQEHLRANASRAGLDIDAYLRSLVERDTSLTPPHREPLAGDRTLELLAQWREEDASLTQEDRAQREREWEELKANLNASRAETGERPLFT